MLPIWKATTEKKLKRTMQVEPKKQFGEENNLSWRLPTSYIKLPMVNANIYQFLFVVGRRLGHLYSTATDCKYHYFISELNVLLPQKAPLQKIFKRWKRPIYSFLLHCTVQPFRSMNTAFWLSRKCLGQRTAAYKLSQETLILEKFNNEVLREDKPFWKP